MSNFTPLVTKEYEFDGDNVKVTFARMKRKDMLKVMPAFKRLQDSEEGSDEYREAINDVLNDVADSLPEYIESVNGLNDANNEPVTIEIIAGEMYFMILCARIAVDLMKESSTIGGKV